MLSEIRDRSSGWIAWVLAILIIIPMAFWGIGEYASTEVETNVVTVGDSDISQREYQAALQAQQQRFREQLGQNISQEVLNSPAFKQSVLRELMRQRAVSQIADKDTYQIGDVQLARVIKENPVFQEDGGFSQDAFNRYAAQSGYARQQFEENIRNQATLGQVVSGFAESSFVLPEETRQILEWQVEQRSFELLTVDPKQFVDQVELSDEELQAYYQDNISAFLRDASTIVQYVELDAEQFKKDVSVSEETLLSIYEENKESLRSEEVRDTRHILLSLDDGDEAALAKANELKSRLDNGEDFAELAKQFSADPGSANNGGSLGKVQKGQMVPEFEEANFSIAQGVVSEPVKSQFGYHLIKVDDIELPSQKAFDEVRSELEQQELDRLAQEILIEKEETLRNLAYEFSEDLDTVAEELGLEIKTTAEFTQVVGEGIATNQAVRQAAFSEEVSVDRLNSQPINLSDTKVVVIRTLEFKAQAPYPYEEVTDQLAAQLTQLEASELASQKISSLVELAKSDWQSAKDDPATQVSEHTLTMVDTSGAIEAEVIREAFSINLDNNVSSVEGRDGNGYMIKLNAITPGDVASADASLKQQTQALLNRRLGNQLFADYLDHYVDSISSEINTDLL